MVSAFPFVVDFDNELTQTYDYHLFDCESTFWDDNQSDISFSSSDHFSSSSSENDSEIEPEIVVNEDAPWSSE